MKKFLRSIVLTASVLCMPIASFQPDAPLRLRFVGNAEAIIGMPWTPLSFAGVARRTMYREAAWNAAAYNVAATNAATANMAYANAAAAQAAAAAAQSAAASLPIGTTVPYLPPNCNSTLINGVNYFNCNGVYYKAGFQGNNVVYIVSTP